MSQVYDPINAMLGRVLAFRGDNEVMTNGGAPIEVTEVSGGQVELAFDVGKLRVYAAFDLADLRVIVARMEAVHD